MYLTELHKGLLKVTGLAAHESCCRDFGLRAGRLEAAWGFVGSLGRPGRFVGYGL